MHRSRKTAKPRSSEGELGAPVSEETHSRLRMEMIGKRRINRIGREFKWLERESQSSTSFEMMNIKVSENGLVYRQNSFIHAH
ncbi:MAG: hypothetical protein ACI92G_001093 [Candidatus Pelagisphaera sp.]|jgi:hypothetical protein